MKKQIVVSLLMATISFNASAIDLSIGGVRIIKAEDPQVIKDVVDATKHAGTQVANGAREIIGAVGNATGISNIIDSNQKTFADLGAAYACIATLCYSEEIKKQELERVEREVKESYEVQLLQLKKYYSRLDKDTVTSELFAVWEKSYAHWNVLNEHEALLAKKQDTLRAAHSAAGAEILYRKALREKSVNTPPPPANLEMHQPTLEFQKNMDVDYEKSLVKVNSEIARLEKITGRAKSHLMAEFIRLLAEPRLYDLRKHAKSESDINMAELKRVRSEKRQALADLEWARTRYEAETK